MIPFYFHWMSCYSIFSQTELITSVTHGMKSKSGWFPGCGEPKIRTGDGYENNRREEYQRGTCVEGMLARRDGDSPVWMF